MESEGRHLMNEEEALTHDQAVSHDEHVSAPTPPGRAKRKRRIVVFLLVSLLNIGLLTLLASFVLNPVQGTSSGGAASPLIGKSAPDFTLPLLGASTTSTMHLSVLKGRPVILNFWASWCDPCKQEAPLLQQTWQRVAGQGALLIGIDSSDTTDPAKAFVAHYGITYPNVVDTVNGVTAINYGVTGFPETFFLDQHGIVIRKEIGVLSAPMIQQDLRLLGISPTALSRSPSGSPDVRLGRDTTVQTCRRDIHQ